MEDRLSTRQYRHQWLQINLRLSELVWHDETVQAKLLHQSYLVLIRQVPMACCQILLLIPAVVQDAYAVLSIPALVFLWQLLQ